MFKYKLNMSYYSFSSVKTEILEPIVHNSSDRSEFQITGKVMPNLKLINLGQYGNAAVSTNDLVGQYSHIKHITLYDGRNVLTQQRDFNDFMSFELLNNSNKFNHQINRNKVKNLVGYKNFYEGADAATQYTRKTHIKDQINTSLDATDSQTGQKKSSLDLRDVLLMLNSVEILSDKVFNQLRLVIEYDQDFKKRLDVDNVTDTLANRPLLIVDRVMNEQMAKDLEDSLADTFWMESEKDTMLIDENPNAARDSSDIQTTEHRINGFNNKRVGKLRISKRYQAMSNNFNSNSVVGYGPYQSIKGLREKFQIRANGADVLPRSGQEGPMRALALLCDTYESDLNLKEDDAILMNSATPKLATDKQGQLSHFGVHLGEREIQDLKISYTRTMEPDTDTPSRYNEALRLDVVGEVVKQIEFRNGSYLVSYA